MAPNTNTYIVFVFACDHQNITLDFNEIEIL